MRRRLLAGAAFALLVFPATGHAQSGGVDRPRTDRRRGLRHRRARAHRLALRGHPAHAPARRRGELPLPHRRRAAQRARAHRAAARRRPPPGRAHPHGLEAHRPHAHADVDAAAGRADARRLRRAPARRRPRAAARCAAPRPPRAARASPSSRPRRPRPRGAARPRSAAASSRSAAPTPGATRSAPRAAPSTHRGQDLLTAGGHADRHAARGHRDLARLPGRPAPATTSSSTPTTGATSSSCTCRPARSRCQGRRRSLPARCSRERARPATPRRPHLHFEIWPDGWYASDDSQPIDPAPDLRAWAADRLTRRGRSSCVPERTREHCAPPRRPSSLAVRLAAGRALAGAAPPADRRHGRHQRPAAQASASRATPRARSPRGSRSPRVSKPLSMSPRTRPSRPTPGDASRVRTALARARLDLTALHRLQGSGATEVSVQREFASIEPLDLAPRHAARRRPRARRRPHPPPCRDRNCSPTTSS